MEGRHGAHVLRVGELGAGLKRGQQRSGYYGIMEVESVTRFAQHCFSDTTKHEATTWR